MTTSDLNQETQMPHRVSLGDILASIQVTPGEANALLTRWADHFLGGAHHNLGRMLRDHATMVADPQTYGYKPPTASPAAITGQPEYVPPTAPVYAQQFGGANVDAGVASEQRRDPAAQGQATTFPTLATPAVDASRNQPTNDPNQAFTSPAVGGAGGPVTDIHGVSLTPDETRQYQHPQGGALDRLAMQQRDERIAQLERDLAEARSQKQPDSPFSVRSEATRPEDIA